MTDTIPSSATPFAHLLQSRDLAFLWLMRIVVHLCDPDDLWCPNRSLYRPLRQRLELHDLPLTNETERAYFAERLASTLEAMERQTYVYRHGPVLTTNLDMLTGQLSLSDLEAQVLALAVLFRADDILDQIADETRRSVNLPRQLMMVLHAPIEELSRVVQPNALLRRAGLLEFQSGGPLGCNIQVKRGSLRRLAIAPLASLNDLLGDGLVRPAPPSNLQAEDYAHIRGTLDILCPLLDDAIAHQRHGVNDLQADASNHATRRIAPRVLNRFASTRYFWSSKPAGFWRGVWRTLV